MLGAAVIAAVAVLTAVTLPSRRGAVGAGAATSGPQGAHARGTQKPAPEYRLGELVVKFKPEWSLPAAQLYQRGESFSAYTGSSYLDSLQQRYRVKGIRPLITVLQPVGSNQSRAAVSADDWNTHVQSIRQRFAIRAQRAVGNQRMPDLSTVYVLTVPEDTDVRQLAGEYAADPSVEYAEPNYLYELHLMPDDPFFSSSGSWGQNFPDLWGLHNISAEAAWDLATGAGVTVAVIDTGLNTDRRDGVHPDIAANLWTNPGEIPDNGIDDDGNGVIDDVHGWMFGNPPTGRPTDAFGHGTDVAGIIAAAGNNGAGVVGVAWQAKVMAVRIFDGSGGTSSEIIAAGIMYATDMGADVANMSFGGAGESFVVRDAIDYAAANGVVLVASAGNSALDVKGTYPANLDPVIAVSAVDHLDQLASFSNYGGKIELAAPGGGDSGRGFEPFNSVLSLSSANCCWGQGEFNDLRLTLSAPVGNVLAFFVRHSGTSFSAPHVSGAAALVLSRHPEFTTEQVRQVLRDSADDLGPAGRDAQYGYGRLNAGRAVAIDAVAVARLHSPAHLTRVHGDSVTVEGTAQDPSGGAPSWRLLLGPRDGVLTEIAAGASAVDHGVLATVDTNPLPRGNYLLRLEVSGANAAASDTVAFTRVANRPYVRQLSDSADVVNQDFRLRPDAWTNDGGRVVWTEQVAPGFHRIVARDLLQTDGRVIAEFRAGGEYILPGPPTVDSVISGDGSTIAFSAPEDLSTSLAQPFGRNFQLFTFDTGADTLTQTSHTAGGGFTTDFVGLVISADGGRIAFASQLDLDPTVGNADGSQELFYWDRTAARFHQVTNTSGVSPLVPLSISMSADGNTIAFLSTAAPYPNIGDGGGGLFLYDVPTQSLRQLTPLSALGRVGPFVALSPDATQIGLWTGSLSAPERTLLRIAAADGAMTEVLTTSNPSSRPEVITFSKDGAAMVFPADVVGPPGANTAGDREIFRYDLAAGQLQQLSAFNFGQGYGISAGTDGRIAFIEDSPSRIDPEGANDDGRLGSDEIYLLDPSGNGGLLQLTHGRLTQGRDRDRFTVTGQLAQPSGTGLNPAAEDVSVTLLATNGQLFRTTLPPGSMKRTATGWTLRKSLGSGLSRLSLTVTDGTHYKFRAGGNSAGLFNAATPYLTVEVQIGNAIFSNAQQFRVKRRQLLYP